MTTTGNPSFSCEELAYWFFRLNGCLVLTNFLVHHERTGLEGTDVDILGVRFPYRQELAMSGAHMPDHAVFQPAGRVEPIIAEVKSGLCRLNGPWTNPQKKNMPRLLDAVGAFPPERNDEVAKSLYEKQTYEDADYVCRLFALGRVHNTDLKPPVVQLTWGDVLCFIHERFTTYADVKAQHRQWDCTGKDLYDLVQQEPDAANFIKVVVAGLRP